ncbi:hypothetical protein E8E12_000737 [Didymella heteroderae]|uniref:Uncharacterized protein n=1 Tax=Didymella heteroderae TaxID=1769908 RepID=A0A9P4WX48_9PLEO|nr:hypothetical protein E8E12_000737 [Didymella heteroderae]
MVLGNPYFHGLEITNSRANTSTRNAMLRNTILSLLGKPSRLDTAREHITLATLDLPEKIGTWKCICGHMNSIYHIPSHLHPLGIMACAREECGLTWHPSTNPITPHHRSDLVIVVRLPDPEKPSEDDAPYILPHPKKSVPKKIEDSACPAGYGW